MSLSISPIRRRLFAFSSLLTLGLLTGCGGSVSSSSASGTSGTSGAGGSGASGTSGGNTSSTGAGSSAEKGVTGTAIDVFDPGKDPAQAPRGKDSLALIEALVDDGGTYSTYKGSIADDGTVQIPDVPAGPYWLLVSSSPDVGSPQSAPAHFFANTVHTVDLGSLYSYRQGIDRFTQSTPLKVDATLALPWEAAKDATADHPSRPSTWLTFYSRGANFATDFPSDEPHLIPGTPADGATTVSGMSIDLRDWTWSGGAPRADKGDDLIMLTLSEKRIESDSKAPDAPWASYPTRRVREAASPESPLTVSVGVPASVSGNFRAVPEKTLSFDYKGTLFNKLLDDVPYPNWDSMKLYGTVYVERLDQSGRHRLEGTYLDLLDFVVASREKPKDPGCNPDTTPSGCPGDLILPGDHLSDMKYPANMLGWGQEYVELELRFFNNLAGALPGNLASFWSTYKANLPVADVAGAPIQPLVSFVRNVKVGGKPALGDAATTGVGLTPQITFDPPTIGKPDAYTIEIAALSKDPSDNEIFYNTRTIADLSFPGTTTSVRLPDGLLQAGTQYLFFISAHVAKDLDLAAPFKQSATEASAEMFTGVVSP